MSISEQGQALDALNDLTDHDRRVIDFIEVRYSMDGRVPSPTAIRAHISNYYPTYPNIQPDLTRRPILQGLALRGINIDPASRDALTPEQIACAQVVLDFSDARPIKKKLTDLGISTQKYNNYLRMPAFQDYLKQRAELLLGDTMHVAHTALLQKVEKGDVNAIKLYYEVTGRHTPSQPNQINVDTVLITVLEAIQRHVKDPLILRAIANEIGAISAPETVPGEIVPSLDMLA